MRMSEKKVRNELKLTGQLVSLMSGVTMEREQLEKADKAFQTMASGKWFSLKTAMRQEYIQREDGSVLRICVVTRRGKKPRNACGLLWIHGGGYGIGLPEQCGVFADRLVEDETTVMVLPDYRKSYEAPYPAALDDCYLTHMWMIVNHERLGIRSDQIFTGGESAGGGLAAALCMYARDKGEVSIAFQMPLYPMIDDRPTKSNTGNTAPVWNSEMNDAAWKLYKADQEEVSVYCAPARQTDYSNLPAAFTIVGDLEPFHDEVIAYVQNLYKADVPVMQKVFEGCYHAFDMLMPNSKAGKKAAELEKQAFRYAKAHFFAKQPYENNEG